VIQRQIFCSNFLHVFVTNRFNHHLATDKQQQEKGDPVIDRSNVFLKTDSQCPAEKRHQCLKSSEIQSNQKCVFFVDFFHAKTLADGYRKCIHRESDTNQK
jgi:hypothetical protein